MKYYTLEIVLNYEMPDGCAPERISEEINEAVDVMQDKLAIEDVYGVLNRSLQQIVFSFLVNVADGESTEGAMLRGLGDLRTALHTAGGSTPQWPQPSDLPMLSMRFSPAEVREEVSV